MINKLSIFFVLLLICGGFMSTEADSEFIKKIPHSEALAQTVYQDVKRYLGLKEDFPLNTRLHKLGLGSKKSLISMFAKFEKDRIGLFCRDLNSKQFRARWMTFSDLINHTIVW